MTGLRISFWAQSLDNTSPDLLEDQGLALPVSEIEKRRDLVSRFSAVTITEPVLAEPRARAFLAGEEFAIHAFPEELDAAGRRSPVACLGKVPTGADPAFQDEVVTALDAFAARAGRTLSAVTRADSRRVVAAVQKKKRSSKWRRRVAGMAAVLLLLFVIRWLV